MLLRLFVATSFLWAVIALATQAIAASRGHATDFARPAGRAHRGWLYNFTVAMTPAHKETVRNHPFEFALGAVMHAGAGLALVAVVTLAARPAAGLELASLFRPLFALSLLAGLALFFRRLRSPDLRPLSVPDDYAANLATCGLLVGALLAASGTGGSIDAAGPAATPTIPPAAAAFLAYSGLFLLYFPLGKLRHAVFFFLVRGEYGRRLGIRGVYPPARAGTE